VLLASNYGRYGCHRVAAMLNESGIVVGKERVQRIWRREGLKVPQKQPRRSRLWLNDGSCIRLRPEHPNHVWSFDFVEAQTHDGRRLRLMTLIDELSRNCLRSGWFGGSTPSMSSRPWPMPCCSRESRPSFVQITAQKWSPRPSGNGCQGLAPGACLSSPDHLGRMAIASSSTANSGMNCSMAQSSTASRRRKLSSRTAASITTRDDHIRHSVTDRRRPSPSRYRHHSTEQQICNRLSLDLVQIIGQAIRI